MPTDAKSIIAGVLLFVAAAIIGRWLAKKLTKTEYSPETQEAIDEFERRKREGE